MSPSKVLSRPVLLIGFMGCGKSSIGRSVARRLNVPFVDLDAQIEERAGTSIANLFASRGEDSFRNIETEVLRGALHQPAVIATGGGIVTRDENRALMQQARAEGAATVVYLRAQPQTLAARIRRQPGIRPLIDGQSTLNHAQTVARVCELLATRSPLYEACAGFIVDSDNKSLDEVAGAVIEHLHLTHQSQSHQ